MVLSRAQVLPEELFDMLVADLLGVIIVLFLFGVLPFVFLRSEGGLQHPGVLFRPGQAEAQVFHFPLLLSPLAFSFVALPESVEGVCN